jgi:hypothetical protein
MRQNQKKLWTEIAVAIIAGGTLLAQVDFLIYKLVYHFFGRLWANAAASELIGIYLAIAVVWIRLRNKTENKTSADYKEEAQHILFNLSLYETTAPGPLFKLIYKISLDADLPAKEKKELIEYIISYM